MSKLVVILSSSVFCGATLSNGSEAEKREAAASLAALWKACSLGDTELLCESLDWSGFLQNALVSRACLYLMIGREPFPRWKTVANPPRTPLKKTVEAYEAKVLSETKRLVGEILKIDRIRSSFSSGFRLVNFERLDKNSYSLWVTFPRKAGARGGVLWRFRLSRRGKSLKVKACSFLGELGCRAFLAELFPSGYTIEIRSTRLGNAFSKLGALLYLMGLEGEISLCRRIFWCLVDAECNKDWLIFVPLFLQALVLKRPELARELRLAVYEGGLIEKLHHVHAPLRLTIGVFLCRIGLEDGLSVLLAKKDVAQIGRFGRLWEAVAPVGLRRLILDFSVEDLKDPAGLSRLQESLKQRSIEQRFEDRVVAYAGRKGGGISFAEAAEFAALCQAAADAGVEGALHRFVEALELAMMAYKKRPEWRSQCCKEFVQLKFEMARLLYVSLYNGGVDKKIVQKIRFYPLCCSTGHPRRLYEVLFELCLRTDPCRECLEQRKAESERILSWLRAIRLGAPKIRFLSFLGRDMREQMITPWWKWLKRQKLCWRP